MRKRRRVERDVGWVERSEAHPQHGWSLTVGLAQLDPPYDCEDSRTDINVMSRLRWIMIGMLGCPLSASGAQPADRAPSSAPVATDRVAALPDGDVRDVLLLLDDGPLHLRFRVTLSGLSLTAARDAYVDKLLQKLDTNGDGKLSPEELARSPLAPPRRAS